MSQKIKWGVLGLARIARTQVIPAILCADNSKFYAIASRNSDKLQECKAQFGCEVTYDNYLDLLKDPLVQAVYIPLPNSMHKEWTIEAIRCGKHVLCEKPIALNQAECIEMVKVAEKQQAILMEAFMYRYTERIRKVQELLSQGVIGQLKYIRSSYRFLLDRPNTIKIQPELGGGSLYDVGCYPINFIGMVTGKSPVASSAQYMLENGVDTHFSAVLKYDDGVIATIDSGFNAFRRIHSEIIGTQGVLEIPDTFMGDAGKLILTTEEGVREIAVAASERYELEIRDFAQAIIDHRQLNSLWLKRFAIWV